MKRPLAGGEGDGLAEFADLLDAVVGGAVDFEDIESAAFCDFDAKGIIGIEVDFGSIGAVQSFGEDTGGGGFSGAAGADEEVGVGKAFLLNGIAEGVNDMILSEDVGKGPRTVFSGENLIAHEGGV